MLISKLLRNPLVWNYWHGKCLPSASQTFRNYSRGRKSYYQTLGITSTATQAEIKKAYYTLSLKYHPDKSKGKEEQFKEITTAYEVLGNPRIRRLYDRGMISNEEVESSVDYSAESDEKNDLHSEHAEHVRTSVQSTYDSWSKNQSTSAFHRAQSEKQGRKDHDTLKDIKKDQSGSEYVLLTFGVVIMLTLIFNYKEKSKKS